MKAAWSLSIVETIALYRSRQATPGEILRGILDRVDAVNPKINAFAALDADGALRAAAESDRRWQDGRPLGPLDGIAVTIKDNITVKDLPCAWGSEVFRDFIPQADELPVARLRAAGAVILGKTTVSEFTIAQTNVNTRAFGTTRNPWDPSRTTGASSGGAAAAVASGLGTAALGTDGGGSIRRPACHCGLVGLKPSTGRVARRDGLPIILDDCEVIGPLARTVDDLAIVLHVIAQPHPEDRASLAFGPSAEAMPPTTIGRKKILYIPRFGGHHVEPEIVDACSKAARQLVDLGHDVQEGEAPFDTGIFDRYWPTISEAGLAWLLRGRDWMGRISALHAGMAERGARFTALDYVDALTAFRELQAQLGRVFATYDLLMTPTGGALPWVAEEQGPPYNRVFTGFVNAGGLPAINIPCDPAPNGLPIGFQLVGPFGGDWPLVAIARQFESRYPWAERWPAI